MSESDQLKRDIESLLRRAKTVGVDPSNYGTLIDECYLRLSLLETRVPLAPRLFRDRTRVSNQLRGALEMLEAGANSETVQSVIACLETQVLPYLSALALEDAKSSSKITRRPGELTGAQLGSWKVKLSIGAGGHSTVYEAEHVLTGTVVCLKALPIDHQHRREQEARFKREIRVPADVGHPALVRVLDAGVSDEFDALFIVMDLVHGQPIDAWSRNKRPSEIVDAIRRILEALQACHDRGFVHRDLKPGNLLVTKTNDVFVLDFGLTSMVGGEPQTRSGEFLGTVQYVAPEQARNAKSATAACDIWSLGVILYELLTKRQLFPQQSKTEVLSALLLGDIPDPGDHLSEPWLSVVRKCIHHAPNDRYDSAEDLSKALAELKPPRPVQALVAPEPRPKQDPPKQPVSEVTEASQGVAIDIPRAEPLLSPYTLEFDTCDFCGAFGEWSGSRCTRCGRARGVD